MVAEYGAIIKSLTWLLDHRIVDRPVQIKSSNEVVIRQLTGVYEVASEGLMPLWKQAQSLSRMVHVQFLEIHSVERAEIKQLSRLARAREHEVEFGYIPDRPESRWKFELHGYVCRISRQRYSDKNRWIRDAREPLYERNFGREIHAMHYKNFRELFIEDVEYRSQYRVSHFTPRQE